MPIFVAGSLWAQQIISYETDFYFTFTYSSFVGSGDFSAGEKQLD
jgi:hypothetical protein